MKCDGCGCTFYRTIKSRQFGKDLCIDCFKAAHGGRIPSADDKRREAS